MNIRSALINQGSALTAGDMAPPSGVSALSVAAFAYSFLFRRFWLMLRVLLLPIFAAGVVLYVCLGAYISELLVFLAAPGPQVASVALGTLAAGIFLSLFCYSLAVSSVMDIFRGKPQRSPWALLRTQRQDWRVYAAYLRVLLIISAGLVAICLAGAFGIPLLISQTVPPWVLTLLGAAGAYWLVARIGFLVAPVIAAGEGTVLREGWARSSRNVLRNCVLIALLAAPGCLVWFSGELLFRLEWANPYVNAGSTLAEYANAMAQTLGQFVAVASVSAFVSIILLTAGAMHVYRQN